MARENGGKALWDERSPIHFASRIRATLHVHAGGKDPRCPKSEAEAIVRSVAKNGGAAEVHIDADEGHVFSRVENNIDSYRRIEAFLDSYAKTVQARRQ